MLNILKEEYDTLVLERFYLKKNVKSTKDQLGVKQILRFKKIKVKKDEIYKSKWLIKLLYEIYDRRLRRILRRWMIINSEV